MTTPAIRNQGSQIVPALIADAGDQAARRFLEFFTANIRNRNTRAAYAQAVAQFLRWCEDRGFRTTIIERRFAANFHVT